MQEPLQKQGLTWCPNTNISIVWVWEQLTVYAERPRQFSVTQTQYLCNDHEQVDTHDAISDIKIF